MEHSELLKCESGIEKLISTLIVKASPVMLQIKPAVLVRLTNCQHIQELKRYDLFCIHQQKILDILKTDYFILKKTDKDLQVLFYDHELLSEVLDDFDVQLFLAKQGYTPCMDVNECLQELRIRMERKDFPHEIGIFLGYPLCDVEGFIANSKASIPVNKGMWKVFDNPTEAIHLMWTYRFAEDIGRLALKKYKSIADCVSHLRTATV